MTTTQDDLALIEEVKTKLEERLLAMDFEVPMLPEVAISLVQNPMNEESDIRELCKLIHRDQALAALVLRVANSAAFRGARAVTSLDQAVMRLGMRQMREIALAAAFESRLFHVPGYEELMKSLWRLSSGSGAFAKEIAAMLDGDVESAFMCGLLHDVGKPVVLLSLVDIQSELKRELPRPQLVQMLLENHTTVGTVLAEQWRLPPHVKEVIAYCSKYDEAPNFRQEAAIVCLAEDLANFTFFEGLDEQKLRTHGVFEEIGFSAERIDKLLERREKVKEYVESFS